MSLSERRIQIGSYLGIQPITHGQIYTFQIAIPNTETVDIPLERRELLARTLREHQSNLVSLVVRRTEAYDEEKEYEIVYGADWCIIAQELEIERLWVWVFDLTDEQAITMKTELEQLLGSSSVPSIPAPVITQDTQPLELQLQHQLRELKELQVRQDKETKAQFQGLSQAISSGNSYLNNRLQQLENGVHELITHLNTLTQLVEKLTVTPPLFTQISNRGYHDLTVPELKEIAKKRNLKISSRMRKNEIINAILSTE